MLPTPTPDDAGDASFLGPSRDPNQKADMGSRARARQRPQKQQPKKNSPQASPETQKQQFVAGVARARARRPENQREKKTRTAQQASQPAQHSSC